MLEITPLDCDMIIKPILNQADFDLMQQKLGNNQNLTFGKDRIDVKKLLYPESYKVFLEDMHDFGATLKKNLSKKYSVFGRILGILYNVETTEQIPVRLTLNHITPRANTDISIKAVCVRSGRTFAVAPRKRRRKHRHVEVPEVVEDVVEDVVEEAPRKRRRKHKKTEEEAQD